jgi:hypothetical protein
MNQDFKIAGTITEIEIVAIGRRICELRGLEKRFGRGRWRKLKGGSDGQPHEWYDTPG